MLHERKASETHNQKRKSGFPITVTYCLPQTDEKIADFFEKRNERISDLRKPPYESVGPFYRFSSNIFSHKAFSWQKYTLKPFMKKRL